jgi:hypothetical protein
MSGRRSLRAGACLTALTIAVPLFVHRTAEPSVALAAPTTTTTAAPVVTAPPPVPETTTTSAVPAPVVTSPPTTARPRPTVTTVKPAARVAQAAPATYTVEERGAQALARINYPWQRLGYTISFEAGHDTYLGLTESSPRVIHIYVRAGESLDTLARTIGHELGHALDFSYTSDAEHAQYITIRGLDASVDSWYGCDACEDYSTAAGDWAETFQYWLLGPGQYYSKMGPPPSADQLAQLDTLFAAP